MNILNHYTSAFQNYADFKGRTTRPQFWYFALLHFLAIVILSSIDSAIGTSLFSTIYLLATIVPALAIGVRRLHDAGHSGWLILLGLIPVLGAAILIILYVQPSKGAAPQAQTPMPATSPEAQPMQQTSAPQPETPKEDIM